MKTWQHGCNLREARRKEGKRKTESQQKHKRDLKKEKGHEEGYRSCSGGGGPRGDAPGLGFGVRHHRRQGLPSNTPPSLPEHDAPELLGQQQRLAARRRRNLLRLRHGHLDPRRRHQHPPGSALGQVSPSSPLSSSSARLRPGGFLF